jgi:molybdopterin-containing oxidoreductase family membrane subunit
MQIVEFARFALRQVLVGKGSYYAWLAFLLLLIMIGVAGYSQQVIHGHIASNLRDPVPWGIFIGTYAFFVGVAAAAVALSVPGYVYGWKPIQEIVVLGEASGICCRVSESPTCRDR